MKTLTLLPALCLSACLFNKTAEPIDFAEKRASVLANQDLIGPPDIETLMIWADNKRATSGRIATFLDNLPDGEGLAQIKRYSDAGDPEAQVMYGYMIAEADRANIGEAIELWEKAYAQDSAAAAHNLLFVKSRYDGFSLSEAEAKTYVFAMKNWSPSHYHIYHAEQRMIVDNSGRLRLTNGLRKHLDLASESGSSRAAWLIGKTLFEAGDPSKLDEALYYLELAHSRGDYDAGVMIANHFIALETKDGIRRGRTLLTDLSWKGSGPAQWSLYHHLNQPMASEDDLRTADVVLDLIIERDDLDGRVIRSRQNLEKAQRVEDADAIEVALQDLTHIAERGNVRAWNAIAQYWASDTTPTNHLAVTEALIESHVLGDHNAMYSMIMYFTMKGDIEESKLAESFLRARVIADESEAREHLWTFLYNRDVEAANWADINAVMIPEWEITQDANLANMIAANFIMLEDWDKATVWSRHAVGLGNAAVQLRYATLIADHGKETSDPSKAFVYLQNLLQREGEQSDFYRKIETKIAELKPSLTDEELALSATLQASCRFADPMVCEGIWSEDQTL